MSGEREKKRKQRAIVALSGLVAASAGVAVIGFTVGSGSASAATQSSGQAAQEADAAAGAATGPLPSTTTTPISSRDRVYTADQTSNTVTVIDPATNKVLGTIALGAQRLSSELSPQYLGDIDVHGLAYSPGHQRLAVVSTGSDTVDIIDTATNQVLSHTDVGRASHEGAFNKSGTQFWVADRARDTITIVNAVQGGVIANVNVGPGPSKVVMSPDGKYAYINHISEPVVTVVNVATRQVVANITGLADSFSSDEAISPDGKQLWVAHKKVGKVTVVNLVDDKVQAILNTGPDTNHPNFAALPTGEFAYVTVGGLNATKVYRVTSTGTPPLVAVIHDHGNAPHGIWPSGDWTRMYVDMEKSDRVDVINTANNKVIDTLNVGQEPQALVYVPDAVPAGTTDADTQNLGTQGLGQPGVDVPTTLPNGSPGEKLDPVLGKPFEATVRPVAGLDMFELEVRNQKPNTTYEAYSVAANGTESPIVSFTTDANGTAPQVLAFSYFTGRSIALKVAPSAQQPTAGEIASSLTDEDELYANCS